MDGSQTPPPERTLITEKMGSIYIANKQPKAMPKMVPKIPVKAPHIINIRIIEPRDSPIVRNIPISLPLFLTNMIKPDIIFIDYLNICASSRFKAGLNINSYTLVKSIAEELRGLAVETNVPIMSATQTTRSGFVSSDIGLEDTSESFGLPATADFMFALVTNDKLEQKNLISVKQLKNRYNDPTVNKKFYLKIDRAKMRLSDAPLEEQIDLVDSGQDTSEIDSALFDKTSFGKRNLDFSKLKV